MLIDTTLISVVMPVHNGAAFLDASIGSVLGQHHRHLELIVVDDASTDGSAAIIGAYAARDHRVVPVILPERGGAQRARNAGVAAARGDLVAHLDQDNVALPERLAAQRQWMRQHGVDVCGSCTWVFGDADYLQWVPETHEDIVIEFLFRTAMVHSTTMLSAAIARANPFDEDAVYGGYELLTRLAARFRLGNVPQVLVKYRMHSGQRTRVHSSVVRDDRNRSRERHFFATFPGSSADDYAAIIRVADAQPFATAAERRLADAWMARLSNTACPFLGDRMRERRLAAVGGAS